ncbi:4-hydroxybenzoate octaprenyltransferase [Blastochloris sulfoviridis]|uniref:4-hydroxybenzoate octaprenyltransferase n=1 Tax=Blastochloris sulfoviridis TaxID=50712 RepID=UPI001FE908BD|nr:4-hydroxybenzoate octaprenyltransferase [Blastochloris sulfoviridis]
MSGQTAHDIRVADAVPDHWADKYTPLGVRPYLRLARIERPIGWWLLLLPCWWSAALAAIAGGAAYPNPWHLVLFLIGAIAMRGAGCTWNDILDRDIDLKVERTRQRPLASGQIRTRAAAAFLLGLGLIGFAVLVQFNGFTIVLGLISMLVVAIYPLMKRITWWPQAFLGLAFSWGALMGWAGAFGRLDLPPLLLYAGAIAWVIGYDTIYAHQDREDDELVGVKSTARLFGTRSREALIALYGAAAVLIGAAVVLAGGHAIALIGVAAFAGHLAWQIRRLDIADPALCLRLFKSNREAGLILFLALGLDAAVQALA